MHNQNRPQDYIQKAGSVICLYLNPSRVNNRPEAARVSMLPATPCALREVFIGTDAHAVRDFAVGNRRGLDQSLSCFRR